MSKWSEKQFQFSLKSLIFAVYNRQFGVKWFDSSQSSY